MGKKANQPSAKERERQVQEWIDDSKRYLNVEGRLTDWEQFLKGALEPSDDKLVPLAQDAIASLQQTRRGIESGDIRAAVVSVLDMAFATCQLLCLDTEPAVAQRAAFLHKNRLLGPGKGKSNAEARYEPIREAFDAIMAETPPPPGKKAARLKLENRLIAEHGENAPKMSMIIRATTAHRKQ